MRVHPRQAPCGRCAGTIRGRAAPSHSGTGRRTRRDLRAHPAAFSPSAPSRPNRNYRQERPRPCTRHCATPVRRHASARCAAQFCRSGHRPHAGASGKPCQYRSRAARKTGRARPFRHQRTADEGRQFRTAGARTATAFLRGWRRLRATTSHRYRSSDRQSVFPQRAGRCTRPVLRAVRCNHRTMAGFAPSDCAQGTGTIARRMLSRHDSCSGPHRHQSR